MRTLFIPLLLVMSSSAFAQAVDSSMQVRRDVLPDAELVSYIEQRVGSDDYVGMIVGFIDGDDTYVQSFGATAKGGKSVPDPSTIFEISSISKTFAAFLLAESTLEGRVSLDAPANRYLDAQSRLQSFDGRDITLTDLAAHQSGMPYLPEGMAVTEGSNPYASTTTTDLLASIKAFVPTSKSGSGYSYSAFAYGVLAHILSEANSASFEKLVAQKITQPLELHDTVFTLNDEQTARLATGYTDVGAPAAPLEQGVFRAAGSMYSTLDDLMIWLRANMHRDGQALSQALELTHEIRNKEHGIGLAWHRTEGFDDRSQFGTALGYRAYIGFLADGSKGTVIFANTKANVQELGARLLLGLETPLN